MPRPCRRLAAARPLAVAGAAFALFGCDAAGPARVPEDRFDYNAAIADSWNDQLLLNLLRIRYGESPFFLQVDAVLTQYALQGNVSATPIFQFEGTVGGNQYGLGAGATFEERPTVTYQPLDGPEFAQRLLRPIDPLAILYLADAGWDVRLLLLACIERINGIPNDDDPNGRFARIGRLLSELQDQNQLLFLAAREGDEPQLALILPPPSPSGRRLRELLGVGPDVERLELVRGPVPRGPDELAIQTRSLYGVMEYVAHRIPVPPEHLRQGRTTRTWDAEEPGPLLDAVFGPQAPANAAAAVYHHDTWFWVPQEDRGSKRMMTMLTQLFRLQAAETEEIIPVPTLPLSG